MATRHSGKGDPSTWPETVRRRGPGKSPAEAGHEALRRSLPVSIRHAVQNYRGIAFADTPEDAKEFQQHQAACKAALQHIEMLMKLAAVTDAGADTPDAAAPNTASIVARAEAAVDAFVNPESSDKRRE